MTDYYTHELRETAKPGEYTMIYFKHTLTAKDEEDILAQKAITEAEANKPAEV
jgi:hypothetical protein